MISIVRELLVCPRAQGHGWMDSCRSMLPLQLLWGRHDCALPCYCCLPKLFSGFYLQAVCKQQ